MKYRRVAVAAMASLLSVATLPTASASTMGCPPAGGWFPVQRGAVIEGRVLPDSFFDAYDRNGDGTLCAKIIAAPEQAPGAPTANLNDNKVQATS